MPQVSNIEYLLHHEIDRAKWDQCVTEAENGLIYAYSFYLDHLSKHWDGLVLNDYEAIMPLTWNKKFGIHYLYQPPFTACLGVFGKNLTEAMIGEFVQAIPKKFKLIEISLNEGNIFSIPTGFSLLNTNYTLWLNKPYHELYQHYRENHQRNIQKALQAGCIVKKNIPVEEIIHLNKEQMKNITPISDSDYQQFKKLCQFLFDQNRAVSYGITDKQNKLLSSCVFFFSHNRAYYILVGNHPDGKNIGASHALIDAFIKDHANKDLILDFEGSDIESLALFYSGFGSQKEIYPALRWNRLPWWLRWMKPKYSVLST
jgi:hypothetical protein